MKQIVIALGCALALAGGSALAADNDAAKSPSSTSQSQSSSGGGIIDKTKDAFHRLGQSVKNGLHKADDKADSARADNKDSTRAMGGPGSQETTGTSSSTSSTSSMRSDRQKRMDAAYEDAKRSGAVKDTSRESSRDTGKSR